MILNIDVGNSYAKWRLEDAGLVVSRGTQSSQSIVEQQKLKLSTHHSFDEARLSLVGQDDIAGILRKQFADDHGIELKSAMVSSVAGGITCGYRDPMSLGVDRWLAVVAAYTRFEQSLVVVDAGSATTLDIVNSDGCHQGGYILPGLELMRKSLWQGTENVKARSSGIVSLSPANCTEDAVNRGSMLALISVIAQTVDKFSGRLVVTGGNASLIKKMSVLPADHIPELVIDGLGVNGVSFK